MNTLMCLYFSGKLGEFYATGKMVVVYSEIYIIEKMILDFLAGLGFSEIELDIVKREDHLPQGDEDRNRIISCNDITINGLNG